MTDRNRGLVESETENLKDTGGMVALNHGPEYKRSPNWKLWHHQLEFAKNRYQEGNMLALFDGLALCRRGNLPLPDWLYDGLSKFGADALKGDLPKGRGRAGNLFATHRDLLMHQERFVAVYTTYALLKDLRSSNESVVRSARGFLGLKPNQTVCSTWLQAYELAADQLKGTFAQGDADAMKDSYNKVAKWERESDPRALEKSIALPETYSALGFSSMRMGTE